MSRDLIQSPCVRGFLLLLLLPRISMCNSQCLISVLIQQQRARLTTVALAFRRVLLCPGSLGLVDEVLLALVLVLRGGDLVPARDGGLV
jgi:hypothetical protein